MVAYQVKSNQLSSSVQIWATHWSLQEVPLELCLQPLPSLTVIKIWMNKMW